MSSRSQSEGSGGRAAWALQSSDTERITSNNNQSSLENLPRGNGNSAQSKQGKVRLLSLLIYLFLSIAQQKMFRSVKDLYNHHLPGISFGTLRRGLGLKNVLKNARWTTVRANSAHVSI